MPDTTVETTTEQTSLSAQDAAVKAAQDRAIAIGDNLKYKVIPIVLRSLDKPGAFVTGFFRKPDLLTQCKLIDKSGAADTEFSMEAAVTAVTALLVTVECDPELTNTQGTYYDQYIKGAAYNLRRFTTIAVPVFF